MRGKGLVIITGCGHACAANIVRHAQQLLRRDNRRADARTQLRTAYDMFTAIGMEAFAERARRELTATGETVRRRSVETVTALTAQEAYIARLARDGLTNPEIGARLFLSARTVEWHGTGITTDAGPRPVHAERSSRSYRRDAA